MPETTQEAFKRGYESGTVNTRLDGHDAQLKEMTSTMSKVVDVEAQLTLAVQSLSLAAKAGEEKALALAVALKDQAEERRNKETDTWSSPKAGKLLAVAVFLVAVVAVWIQWKIANG